MKTISILRNRNVPTQRQNRSVHFNKGIDFAIEEEKSLSRLNIIKGEEVSLIDW